MCGIVGLSRDGDGDLLTEMRDAIRHRGPDDEGAFVTDDVMLGVRRLSIIDLEGGDQPIYNETGDVVVVFNGEIYNYRALRSELTAKGHQFESDTDTEVLVHLWEEYGRDLPEQLDGMFAFALYDREAETLFLARDRLGIKPLYYVQNGESLAWASEIQPLLETGVDRTIDEAALGQYFTLGYTLWPRTLLSNVKKLPPGSSMTVDESGVRTRRYWTFSARPRQKASATPSRLRELLEQSVERRLQADVPVGAFLSGGLDSSAIVGLMAEHTDRLNTYSVGFEHSGIDESREAAFVADHFGTTHHPIEVDLESMSVFGDLVSGFGEPLADPAALPNLLLARRAREDVKVVLTGVGADELFAGYRYHDLLDRHRRLVRWLPDVAHTTARQLQDTAPIGRKYLRHLGALSSDERAYIYWRTRWDTPAEEYLTSDVSMERLADTVGEAFGDAPETDTCGRLMAYDVRHYLTDDLLYLLDHMTMAASLEGRVPFLDHELVEYAMSIPSSEKRAAANKPVLRRAVSDLLPERTLQREKQPFAVPVDTWLDSDHSAVTGWLDADLLSATPYVDADAVQRAWTAHRRDEASNRSLLWRTLCYTAWYHTHLD